MLEYLRSKFLHLCGLGQALVWYELLQVEVDGDLLLGEHVMQQEQVILGDERDRVHEALGVEETLEVVVFAVPLNVLFKFVHIKVPLGMPLLVLEILHVLDFILASESPSKVEPGCLEGPVVDYGNDIGICDSCVDNLLPEAAVGILCKQQIVNGIEHSGVVQAVHDGFQTLQEGLVELWVANGTHTIGIHQMGSIAI